VTVENEYWWVVSGDGMVNHYYPAPTGRSARATFRADLIEGFHSGGFTRAEAILKVRGLNLVILRGPLTTEEAYQDVLGWTWAETICDQNHATEVIPLRPASREDAVAVLGEDRTALIEHQLRTRYHRHK
jgi:hypothetical protein